MQSRQYLPIVQSLAQTMEVTVVLIQQLALSSQRRMGAVLCAIVLGSQVNQTRDASMVVQFKLVEILAKSFGEGCLSCVDVYYSHAEE